MQLWRAGTSITEVIIDTHRWYSTVTVTYANDEQVTKVIGMLPGDDGLGLYDSYEEYERACH